jgi:hypothetical protein
MGGPNDQDMSSTWFHFELKILKHLTTLPPLPFPHANPLWSRRERQFFVIAFLRDFRPWSFGLIVDDPPPPLLLAHRRKKRNPSELLSLPCPFPMLIPCGAVGNGSAANCAGTAWPRHPAPPPVGLVDGKNSAPHRRPWPWMAIAWSGLACTSFP